MNKNIPRYVLRYFFDGVTGTCLWAGNTETVNAFDYPVDLYMLKLPDSLLKVGNQVIDRWTALADEADTVVKKSEYAIFREDARQFLAMLRKHFGSEFEILDESGTTTISSGTSFKIVSGGQTGVDRAALDWAMKHGLPHGGFCPKGRRAEDGVLHEKYQLQETESSRYLQRTKQNVLSSDGTLILNLGSLNDGSRTTLRIAESIGKPCLVQQLDDEITPSDIRRVLDWIRANGIVTLNIAGPRESKRPFIYGRTVAFLDLLFAGPQSVVAT